MRKLAPNELRLLALFGAAIFLALNLFAAKTWLQQSKDVRWQIASARSDVAEGRSWLDGAAAIQPARAWINANPPPTYNAEQASTELLQVARASAETNGLKIVEENLLPPAEVMVGNAAALEFKVSGPFAGVAKLLFTLQSPAAWRAVDMLALRSDTEPPNVVADMKIRQYYRPPNPAPSTPTP